ncbi:phospholipase D family protein [Heyndrickxia sp. FSL K6-6286]|uniref:phospholipase D family protein n=1 Tax=Heyndrickxia sp. FSL K6-6286 TaxID=2921510 RepID=UPI00315A25E3
MRKVLFILVTIFFITYCGTILYHSYKPLPKGLSYEGRIYRGTDKEVTLLTDLTYQRGNELKVEHEIFPRVFQIIQEAEQFIVCDFFLFNGYYDKHLHFPPLSESFANQLINKKKQQPEVRIMVITDEINTSYGSHKSKELERLKKNGIEVIMTDLDPLRDSTPLYSSIWRMFFKWFGQSGQEWIPNAMADNAPKMTIRSYLKLLNIKANHRKTIATDKTVFIASGNPHDASAYFSNHGIEISGPIIHDLLESEQAAVNISNGPKLPIYTEKGGQQGDHQFQLLTEGKIYKHVLREINRLKAGDELWMAMFYLADRKIIHSLLEASQRNVKINLILDPNENAFGNKKSGLPNRPVAHELHKKSKGKIQIRWYNTKKEQFHPKLIFIKKDKYSLIFNGSANLTSRNLADYNLETDIKIKAPNHSKVVHQLNRYFHRLWENRDGDFTLDFSKFQSRFIYFQEGIYRMQELLQLTTY